MQEVAEGTTRFEALRIDWEAYDRWLRRGPFIRDVLEFFRRKHMPTAPVSIINASTVCTDDEIKAMVPALQVQVTRDFAPLWGRDAVLTFVPKGQNPAKGQWWIAVLDNSDQAGALGYHDQTSEDLPIGKVFAATDKKYGAQVSVTLSHELLEQLADPNINSCTLVQEGRSGVLYATEVCDAVEADNLGYQINGIQVSDFIYPSWFIGTAGIYQRFDHLGHCSKALEITPGGYTSLMKLSSRDKWSQKFGDASEHDLADLIGADTQSAPQVGSRRERRIRYGDWKSSTAHTA